jgi:hypothetical protein
MRVAPAAITVALPLEPEAKTVIRTGINDTPGSCASGKWLVIRVRGNQVGTVRTASH